MLTFSEIHLGTIWCGWLVFIDLTLTLPWHPFFNKQFFFAFYFGLLQTKEIIISAVIIISRMLRILLEVFKKMNIKHAFRGNNMSNFVNLEIR